MNKLIFTFIFYYFFTLFPLSAQNQNTLLYTVKGNFASVKAVGFSEYNKIVILANDTKLNKSEIKIIDAKTGKIIENYQENTLIKDLNVADDFFITSGKGYAKYWALWTQRQGILDNSRNKNIAINQILYTHETSQGYQYVVFAKVYKGNAQSLHIEGEVINMYDYEKYKNNKKQLYKIDKGFSIKDIAQQDKYVAFCASKSKESLIQVVLNDVETQQSVQKISTQSLVNSIALSPDGEFLVSGAKNGELIIWKTKTGEVVKDLTQNSESISKVLFTPDGKFILTASNHIIKLWQVDSGKLIQTFVGHTAQINDIAVRHQQEKGYILASVSDDKSLKVWNFFNTSKKVQADTEEIKPKINTARINIQADITQNIPQTKMQNPDAIAVIIGNTNYEKTKNVDFAMNDASLIKQYLIQTLGYKEGNIFHLKDIHKSEFEMLFGTEKNHKGKLFNTVKANKSEVFIYYSGHGVPSIQNKSAYFAPVECDPNYVELSGYSLDIFYNNLAKVPAKSMTIILDACFSGADIYENISPIVVKSKGIIGIKKGTLLTSCQGNEVSSWYNEKGHGLFTYFFLKAIHNKNADFDKNGKLTFQEIQNFISNKTEAVPYFARRLHGIEQNPQLQGEDLEGVFVEY